MKTIELNKTNTQKIGSLNINFCPEEMPVALGKAYYLIGEDLKDWGQKQGLFINRSILWNTDVHRQTDHEKQRQRHSFCQQ